MADSGQVFHDDTAISRALAAVGVDTPIAPPMTGDEGGQTPSSEYFLQFEMALVPQGWAGRTIDVGFGFGHLWFGRCPRGDPEARETGFGPASLLHSLKFSLSQRGAPRRLC